MQHVGRSRTLHVSVGHAILRSDAGQPRVALPLLRWGHLAHFHLATVCNNALETQHHARPSRRSTPGSRRRGQPPLQPANRRLRRMQHEREATVLSDHLTARTCSIRSSSLRKYFPCSHTRNPPPRLRTWRGNAARVQMQESRADSRTYLQRLCTVQQRLVKR